MKLIFLAFVALSFGVKNPKIVPYEFEYRLTKTVTDFRNAIMDEEQCASLKRAADDLSDDIKKALQTEQYTDNEISQMNHLKLQATALEEYISAVGSCGIDYPSIENFNLANSLVKGSVVTARKYKYCVDVLYVTIGNYKVYMLQNTTENILNVTYRYKSSSGMSSGKGNIGLGSKSIRNMYTNRHKKDVGSIVITGVSCSNLGPEPKFEF